MNLYSHPLVAIPSHRRAAGLLEHTLAFLRRMGFPLSRVFVFVSDADDLKDYKAAIPDADGLHLVFAKKASSLRSKFNFIRRYFARGQRVFLLEDDVMSLVEKMGENSVRECADFEAFLREGFDLMESVGARIWGVSPHANAFYMTNNNSINFKFIVAQAFGFVADDDARLDITLDGKSDYERTILYYLADGRTPRLNRFGVKPFASYKGEGGLQAEFDHRTRVYKEEQAVSYLTSRYSLLCYRNEGKKSVMPEIKFRPIKGSHKAVVAAQAARDKELGYGKN